MMTVAEVLSKKSRVDLLLDSHLFSLDIHKIMKKLESRYALDLSKVSLVKAPIGPGSNLAGRALFLRGYDLLICNTDGSIFLSTAKRGYIHFQVPFENTNARGFWGRIKLLSWQEAIYNSSFTRGIIEKSWPIKGEVIYPPVDINFFKPRKKINRIISVGRFFSYDRSKKHQLMIETFKKLVDQHHPEGWDLCLVGGMSEGDREYVEGLKKMSGGYPVDFYPNASRTDLATLYGQSSIYWHAKGFGERDPKTYEHFGISTVEAMAAGCVPIVVNLGGQREIVEDEVSGCLWDSVEEWIDLTIKIIGSEKLRESLATGALERSKKFSKEEFEKRIIKLAYG